MEPGLDRTLDIKLYLFFQAGKRKGKLRLILSLLLEILLVVTETHR